jgi:hypothetical protein
MTLCLHQTAISDIIAIKHEDEMAGNLSVRNLDDDLNLAPETAGGAARSLSRGRAS